MVRIPASRHVPERGQEPEVRGMKLLLDTCVWGEAAKTLGEAGKRCVLWPSVIMT